LRTVWIAHGDLAVGADSKTALACAGAGVCVASSLFAALGGGVHGPFLFSCSSGHDGIVVVLSVTVEPYRGGVMAACPKQSCDRWLARFQQSGCSLELRLFAAGPMSRHSHKKGCRGASRAWRGGFFS
jgi:hypothetical protein